MNRQIKFRGKCSISNEWVYGDLIHGVGAKDKNIYILPRKINLANINHCDPLDGVRVIPETVDQFTGLKDKNGNEIWEGDICNTYDIYQPSELADSIVFHDGSFVFQNEYKLSFELRGFKTDYIEIIGNIHDNPDLLTK